MTLRFGTECPSVRFTGELDSLLQGERLHVFQRGSRSVLASSAPLPREGPNISGARRDWLNKVVFFITGFLGELLVPDAMTFRSDLKPWAPWAESLWARAE